MEAVRLRQRATRNGPAVQGEPNLLAGKLCVEDGKPLTSTQAVNHGRRYRYYVSRDAHQEDGTTVRRGWRLTAGEMERAVAAAARTLLHDQSALASTLVQVDIDLSAIPPILESRPSVRPTHGAATAGANPRARGPAT